MRIFVTMRGRLSLDGPSGHLPGRGCDRRLLLAGTALIGLCAGLAPAAAGPAGAGGKAVAESAVVAKPDATRGEIVKAYVVLAKGFAPSDELVRDIQDFCRNLTAPYKYPREIEFLEALPKTISGKIRRVELQQAARRT